MNKHVLLLHPVAQWSLGRIAAICEREGWRLTIVTIENSTVGDRVTTLHEWIRVPALSDSPGELLSQIGARRFDAVVAGNEFAVIAADVLARELGLHHNDVARIRASRNKALMRRMFQEYGIPQPRTIAELSSVEESRSFDWTGVAFPVIVKPVDMAMSLFVRKCDSREEVEAALTRMSAFRTSRLTNYEFSTDALVEEYVGGPEFSLECVVQDGRVLAHSVTRKFVSPLPACYEIGHISGVDLPEARLRELLTVTERIASSWAMEQGVMHVEFKMTPERISVIEAAARPAGDHVPELVELQQGLSLEDAYLHARVGLPWKPAAREQGDTWHAIRFHYDERSEVPRPASVDVLRSHDEPEGVVPGAEPFSVNSRTGYSMLRSRSQADLDGYIRAT
ncbi:ATP-grasp domain-containing protein [Streptomyces sp. C11-1]|uniref:ATP-grasp domain-containing protein n=1 Tax=Streptomyces durocortorensis TaxID=2811104 RepID=A0ABY9W294_9ACTN|nr:ATP-grasp domain-containing protein [Streptomyces durocortorensis]WNF29196.1 ATP-grasp domain-containing protein [Streptomyces durocortorensis]